MAIWMSAMSAQQEMTERAPAAAAPAPAAAAAPAPKQYFKGVVKQVDYKIAANIFMCNQIFLGDGRRSRGDPRPPS